MKRDFDKKRIVITGAAQGLGKAIALRFARDGWKIAVADVLEEVGEATVAEINNTGGEAFFQCCDVREEGDFIALRERCQQHWDGVDVVVNNAGIASAGPIYRETVESWQRVLAINTIGPAMGCKTFTPVLKGEGGGHIVNIASIAGIACNPIMSSYNASKAGVIALSETLRWELKRDNIGVTVVCPALFKTALTDSMEGVSDKLLAGVNAGMAKSTISADDIADMIYRAVQKNQFMLLPHRATHPMWWLKRLSPDLYQWFVSRFS